MKRNLLLFLLSVCFFLPDFAATGQYNFIRVDGESGLSNSHVKSIIQDSYGFIWLGTRNGLNRYDGVSMKLYNCYDETLQHGNQVISALFEDNHRQLWIGTDDGVYIQDLATGKFSFMIFQSLLISSLNSYAFLLFISCKLNRICISIYQNTNS